MTAKLCHHNADLPGLGMWATQHVSLLLWFPSGTLMQSPVPTHLQHHQALSWNKPWRNPSIRSSCSHQRSLDMESPQPTERTKPPWPATNSACIFIPFLLWSLRDGNFSLVVLRLGSLVSWWLFHLDSPSLRGHALFTSLLNWKQLAFLSQCSLLLYFWCLYYRVRMHFRNISLSAFFLIMFAKLLLHMWCISYLFTGQSRPIWLKYF